MRLKCFIRGPMLVLLLSCCLSVAWSQGTEASESPPSGGITLGVKTGVNLNQFSQPGTSIGFNAGIYGSYDLLPFLTVRLEPQYSQQGGGRPDYNRSYSDISDNISSITYINPSVTFHNIEIPLLVELTLPEFRSETIMPKLILGASYAGTLLTNEMHTKRYFFNDNLPGSSVYSYALDASYRREDVTDNYVRNQWSVIAGFGLQFKAAKRDFSFDIRYRQGTTNLNQLRFASPTYVPGTGGELFSSSLSFNFSMSLYKFNL